MIELAGISKHYLYHGQTIPVLSNVDLKITKGECVCLTMPSGTGKTTLLNIIGGMIVPTSGKVVVDATDLTSIPQHFLAKYRSTKVGFIFQQFNLLANFTVEENLYFPIVPTGRSINSQKKKIKELLNRLQISHRAAFHVNLLSGGEQQRVAVARALINNPEIIIADEPFSNLDPENTSFILDIFNELKKEGKTFILSATSSLMGTTGDFIDREITAW